MRLVTRFTKNELSKFEKYGIEPVEYKWLTDCWMIYGANQLIQIKYDSSSQGLFYAMDGGLYSRQDKKNINSIYLHKYCLELLQQSDNLCLPDEKMSLPSTIYFFITPYKQRIGNIWSREIQELDQDLQDSLPVEKFAKEDKLWMLCDPSINDGSKERIQTIYYKMCE
jgi:hypothetical protein